MDTFKTNYLYIISEIVAIYFTYLFCRQFDFGIKGISIISIINLLSFFFLTKYWIKKNKGKELLKKSKKIVIISSIILSSLLLLSNFRFYAKKYVNNEIEISRIDNKNITTEIINYIQVNNEFYSANIDDYVDEKIIDNKKILLKFKKMDNINITFKNQQGDLKIKDTNSSYTLTFGDSEEKVIYKVSNNYYTDASSILRLIISYISIFYVFIMFMIHFYNNKESRGLIAIIIICLYVGHYYFIRVPMNSISPDSSGYVNYNFDRLWNLQLNGRTPIYPIIIGIMRTLFGLYFLHFLCIFQYFVWFIGMICLYKTILLLTKNNKISILLTTLYIISPAITGWNNMILTESIALSGTLIFIYLIIKYIKTNKCIYGYLSIILSFILTFHRPTSIIYLLGLFIFFILRMIFEKEYFKNELKCFICSVISVILVFIYAILFHNSFGIYSISDAVVRQDLYVSIEQQYYKSSDDSDFIEYVDAMLNEKNNTWDAMTAVLKHYGNKRIREITNYCRTKNFDKYIKYVLDLYKNESYVKFFSSGIKPKTWLYNGLDASFSIISFLHVYIITFIEFIIFICSVVKNKKIPWIHAGLFAFPFIIVFSTFVGTCGEFARTATCCVPFTVISIGLMLNYLCNKTLIINKK